MYSNSPTDPQASRSRDSWIEISSRPSNTSLSSPGPDDIVTTGLHVQQGTSARSRRRQLNRSPLHLNLDNHGPPSAGGGGSSQDEYDESESESDRVMTSSNEGLPHRASSTYSASPEEESEGYNDEDPVTQSTFVGEQCFTPQPNAFTHPPSSSSRQRASAPDSYFPAARPVPSSQRHSFPNDRRPAHSPYNAISPGHQADHDAALRASLTTLLSCAAAARSLPRKSQDNATTVASRAQHASPARIDTATLRMVPESVALGPGPVAQTSHQHPQAQIQRQRRLSASSHQSSSPRDLSPASISPQAQQDKNKRKATNASTGSANVADATTRSNSKDRRLAKKPRRQSSSAVGSGAVDPTLLTWVVSAGVLVLVSALSFSAGYVTGREAGILEASATGGAVRDGAARGCGREVGRGLRRLRWGVASGAAGSVRA